MTRNAKLHCCPLCGSKVLKLHSSDEDLEPGWIPSNLPEANVEIVP